MGNSAFYYCTNLTNINFPNCTSIGSYAFQYCSSLVSVSLPKCVNIYNYAFRSCRYLISLYLLGSSIVSLGGASVFNSTPISTYSTSAGRYGSIFVPSSLYASYKTATYWSAFSSRFVSV